MPLTLSNSPTEVKSPVPFNLESVVADLIALNRAVHDAAPDELKECPEYLRDFGTIVVQSGMRTGKTCLAEKYALDTSTHVITFDNNIGAFLKALDNMDTLTGISTVVIDCWLIGLLSFQVDARMQDAMLAATTSHQKGFSSILSYIAHRVQKAFGPNTVLLILG